MAMRKPRTKPVPAKRPRRASQRTALSIDLADQSLRDLMVEQCRNGPDYVTVYSGSRAELVAGGVPEAAFPSEGSVAEFQVQTLSACCTGSRELLSGSMRCTAAGFELEIDWKSVRPYVQCAHPAVSELARMLLKDVLAWTDKPGAWTDHPDLAHPLDMLLVDERAEYRPRPDAPRLQVTPEFHEKLRNYASYLYEWVHTNCEVMPSESAPASRLRPSLRIVADNTRPGERQSSGSGGAHG